MTKRNDETKSLSDNTGSIWSYAIFYISQPLGHSKARLAIIYMFPAVNYFLDLSHINIQRVKTHTVGNQATTPTLKHVHVDY